MEDLFYTSFFICSSFRMRVGVSTGTVSRAHSREHACISAFNVVPSIVCYSIASLCCVSFTLFSPALSSPSGALLYPFHLVRDCNGHVVDYTVWSASIAGSLLRSRRKGSLQDTKSRVAISLFVFFCRDPRNCSVKVIRMASRFC